MNTWQPAFDQDVVRWAPSAGVRGTLAALFPSGLYPHPLSPGRGLSDRCQRILTMQSVEPGHLAEHIHCKTAVAGLPAG